jgi:hypothetical protein
VWALGNTGALNSDPSTLMLNLTVVDTEPYAFPVASVQQPGPTPLGERELSGLESLDADDHRLQQVMLSGGQLYMALTTAARMPRQPLRNAAAYFVVAVSNSGRNATVSRQGYVGGEANTFLMYPSIGVNAAGRATMVFSLSGGHAFPTVGFWPLGGHSLHVARRGSAPEDGFSGYRFLPSFSRWGDYSAAAVDEQGRIWGAAEYINALPRTAAGNWGTFVLRIGDEDVMDER